MKTLTFIANTVVNVFIVLFVLSLFVIAAFFGSLDAEQRKIPRCGNSSIEVVEVYKDQDMKIINSAGGIRFLVDRNDEGLKLGRCYNVVQCVSRGNWKIESYQQMPCKD